MAVASLRPRALLALSALSHNLDVPMGGLHALRGFDYQIWVTLDVVLARYERPESWELRPEGADDLVFRTPGDARREFIQVKKPREDEYGRPKGIAWSLAELCADLLPNVVARLNGNECVQELVLGDSLDPESARLLSAGGHACSSAPDIYWLTVHQLARRETGVPSAGIEKGKVPLERWRPAESTWSLAEDAEGAVADAYCILAEGWGVPQDTLGRYRAAFRRFAHVLPGVLHRTTARTTYGTDQQVRERVVGGLKARYDLDEAIVARTLLNNLRGFIQDIAVQPERWVNKEEFELEARSVWPRMNLVARPPASGATEIDRTEIVRDILESAQAGPVEVVGPSGAGKTKLAGAIAAAFRDSEGPDLSFYVPVRAQDRLLDVLIGIAFHLRRFGITAPFGRTVSLKAADEEATASATAALVGTRHRMLVAIDLVEGDCSEPFARDLSGVLARLVGTSVQMIVLGQRSAFRYVSRFECVFRLT